MCIKIFIKQIMISLVTNEKTREPIPNIKEKAIPQPETNPGVTSKFLFATPTQKISY